MKPKLIFLTGLLLFLFLFSIPSISAASASSGSVGTPAASSPNISYNARPPITMFNCTDCYAGYGDFGANYSVTSVSTMLTVPSVSCSKKATGYSFWGIQVNGVNASDFAGASVTGACSSGIVHYYAAWFDANVYTACTLCQINATWTPSAGDNVFLGIAYNNYTSRFTFVLVDLSSHQFYARSNYLPGVSLEFGVCASDMYLNSSLITQPSVKFSPVSFTNCLVDGKPVGSAPNGTTVFEFFCTNAAGTGYLAKPSALNRGENFKVSFVATGP